MNQLDLLMCMFPGGSDGKASVYNVGDLGSIPGSGRSPGEGNDNPLQYYCLENPMDTGDSLWGRKESDTTERLHLNIDIRILVHLQFKFNWVFNLSFNTVLLQKGNKFL